MAIRVLLADDQLLLRHGFAMILGAQADIEVVGEAGDGAEAVRLTGLLQPDVVLMDVRMPGMDGIEATRKITSISPPTRVIILTTFDVDEYAFDGLRAGASGFLLKNAQPDELLAGIRSVATGDAVLAPSTTRRVLDAFVSRPAAGAAEPEVLGALTARELDVFTEMAAGATNKEIAQRLYLSETTVKTHVVRILAKLDLRDRTQAVIFAYEQGIKRPKRPEPPRP
jgi:DNA-binding NarL/FixJ family response regulator